MFGIIICYHTIFQILPKPFNSSIRELYLPVSLFVMGILIVWIRTIYMDRKRVTNTLLNLASFMHMWMSSLVTGSFLHAYCLARTMDLSWGNRPGKELQTIDHKEALKACQKTCQKDHCQAVVETPGSNLCKNHMWHIQNTRNWKNAINERKFTN